MYHHDSGPCLADRKVAASKQQKAFSYIHSCPAFAPPCNFPVDTLDGIFFVKGECLGQLKQASRRMLQKSGRWQ